MVHFFELPNKIPEKEKTNVKITLNVTSLVEAGTYNVEKLLDKDKNWNAGDKYSKKLNLPENMVIEKTDSDDNFELYIDKNQIGNINIYEFGTTDEETLRGVNTSKNILPM